MSLTVTDLFCGAGGSALGGTAVAGDLPAADTGLSTGLDSGLERS
jgi:hypothetical protein